MHMFPSTSSTKHPGCAWAFSFPIAVLLALQPSSTAAQALSNGWKTSGDLRAGYFASERTDRAGGESEAEAFNARLRVALERGFGDRWLLRTRVAGRFSSDQDTARAYLRAYAPTRTGTAFGDVTIDEAYLRYTAPEGGLRARIGRFQTQFALPGVASKGLARNDSPNIDVNWTDGVHLDVPVAGGWRAHLVAEHRHRRGSGGVARSPLDFSAGNSRVSLFAAMQNDRAWGPVDHRVLSLGWMPSSLASVGPAAAPREDYLTAQGSISATWPLREDGLRLVAGLEAGYAFNTPPGSAVGTGQAGDSDGLAWQVAASLYDIAPRHHLGVVLGRAGAGWLVSPDFRGNDELVEVRHQWRLGKDTSIESRIRERRELEHPSGTRARVDRDLYVRLSHRF